MKGKKFYYKLIFVYAFIILLYTLAATGVYYYKSGELLTASIHNNQKQFLIQAAEKIDTQLQGALSMISQMKSNEDVTEFSRANERDYYRIASIQKNLSTLTNSFYKYGLKLGIAKAGDELVIASDMTISTGHYYEELGLDDGQIGRVTDFVRDGDRRNSLFVIGGQKDYMTIVKKERLINNEEFIFYISFYKTYLLPNLASSGREGFGIAVNEALIAYSGGAEEALAVLFEPSGAREEFPAGYHQTEKSPNMIHSADSSLLQGWKFFYVVPGDILKDQQHRLIVLSLAVYVVMAAAGLAFALLIARNMYRPIRKLAAVFKGYGGENEGFDDLEFIENTAGRIRRVNETLQRIIEENKLPSKQKMLKDKLLGLPGQDGQEEEEHSGWDHLSGELRVVIVEFPNYRELTKRISKEGIISANRQIPILLEEHLKRQTAFEIIELESMRYVLIVKEAAAGLLHDDLSGLAANLLYMMDLEVVAAAGKPVQGIGELEHSYNSALNLLEYRYAFPHQHVFMTEELHPSTHDDYYYPLELEKELIGYAVKGEKEQARHVLERLLDENLHRRSLDKKTISTFLLLVLASFNRIVSQLKLILPPLEPSVLGTFDSCHELEDNLLGIFESVTDAIATNSRTMDNQVTVKMLEFIHSRYHQDISLNDLAAYLSLSPSYASRLFKNETGENFKDYVNRYRVEMAKRIMLETPLKMDELARRVGCNNVITFTRMFKKYEGIPPGQYFRK
ncbi:MAG: hypothetical protein K0R57_3524 [Paenibacillaceae bacterium]|jgi:YesN/AraC family two-component response regulator|nr:hypothetical protein [Paenibacillaceae bacterium]